MRLHYDKSEDALYLRFNENLYAESVEVSEGIILDYDKKGKIVGLEILDASKKFPKEFKSAVSNRRLPISIGA
ncbi:MAG: DUF2283 domain-containing protein [Candidatus Liptonbacteria bacterium]|nr:DUF2283 domain-containing protein [Candidatus Liptonbacteria bacterium]